MDRQTRFDDTQRMNSQEQLNTALFTAIDLGDLESIKQLIQKGASPFARILEGIPGGFKMNPELVANAGRRCK